MAAILRLRTLIKQRERFAGSSTEPDARWGRFAAQIRCGVVNIESGRRGARSKSAEQPGARAENRWGSARDGPNAAELPRRHRQDKAMLRGRTDKTTRNGQREDRAGSSPGCRGSALIL